jgi:hypothetical protein
MGKREGLLFPEKKKQKGFIFWAMGGGTTVRNNNEGRRNG